MPTLPPAWKTVVAAGVKWSGTSTRSQQPLDRQRSLDHRRAITLADVGWAVILSACGGGLGRRADRRVPAVDAYGRRPGAPELVAPRWTTTSTSLVRRGTERIVAGEGRGGALAELYAATSTLMAPDAGP